MKSRVTITLDPEVHARAKQAARARRTTVSGLIESFLRSPAAAPPMAHGGRSLVDEMVGSAELRSLAPGTDPLFDALHRRYITPRGGRRSASKR
jgi:hypothetical protein